MKLLEGFVNYNFEGKKPTDLVVLLHGYGSSGKDLISLSKHFEDTFERPYFIAPNAPEEYEFAGASFPNEWQWFSLVDRGSEALLKGVRGAEKVLNHFLDETLKKFDLTDKNLILMGFSQGSMVALHTALRRKNPCAGLVIFAGSMLSPEVLPNEIISRPKTCFIHGTEDKIVPPVLGKIGHKYAKENNVESEFFEIPGLEHYINFEALEKAKSFLKVR